MIKRLQKIHILIALAILLQFVIMLFTYRLNIVSYVDKDGFVVLNEYEHSTTSDPQSPIGVSDTIVLPIRGIDTANTHLVFYSIHQNVSVFVEGECIYKMTDSRNNLFGKTPGCVWNNILLSPHYNGKEVKIQLRPAYESSLGMVPVFYFGGRYSIVNAVVRKDAWSLLISLAAIIIGAIYILYVKYNEENSEVNKKLSMLGCFSIALGLWKFTDAPAAKMLIRDEIVISMVPFMALILSVIPLMLFLKELFSTKDHIIWYVVCWCSVADAGVCLCLQVTDAMDLRQSFIMTVAIIAFAACVLIGMVIYEIVRVGWDRKLQWNIIGAAICIIGVSYDLLHYYLSGGTSTTFIGILIFLIYVIVQGYLEFKEARELAIIGRKSQNFEKMAYHDQLTGVFNRTAFAEDTDRLTFDPDRAILLVFDLNNLKKTNDTLGHEMGDRYIRDSAKLLQDTFGEIGKCYRTGGDEFCCLVINSGLDLCKQKIENMRQKVAVYNRKSKDVHMGIACGYALYDRRIDYDINDTAKRADKMMYADKEAIKKKEAAQDKKQESEE